MIDILLAAYNGAEYIGEQIESILDQELTVDMKLKDIRLIIRDDGSSDNTLELIRKYKEKQEASGGIQIILAEDNEPTGRPAANFQKLLAMSDADYVMFSDQDDIWNSRKVILTYAFMKKKEEELGDKDTPVLVHTDLRVINETGEKISDSFYEMQKLPEDDSLNHLLIQNTVTGCTMMLNKCAANMLKQAPASEMVLQHDQYAAIMTAATGHVYLLPMPLISYRQHGDNAVGAMEAGSSEDIKRRTASGKSKFRDDMELSYKQAEYILNRYRGAIAAAGGDERLAMMEDYAALSDVSPSVRRKVYKKYGIYKSGGVKKIVQKLWC